MMYIGKYDYGFGNELVPYVQQHITTVMCVSGLVIVSVLILYLLVLAISGKKADHIWQSLSQAAVAVGTIFALFSLAIFNEMTISLILILAVIIIGIPLCLIGIHLDNKNLEEQERIARFKRRRATRRWIEANWEEDEFYGIHSLLD